MVSDGAASEAPKSFHDLNEEREHTLIEEDALRSAVAHIRNAKGVLDSFPATHQYVGEVERLANKLDKKRKPLTNKLEKWAAERRKVG